MFGATQQHSKTSQLDQFSMMNNSNTASQPFMQVRSIQPVQPQIFRSHQQTDVSAQSQSQLTNIAQVTSNAELPLSDQLNNQIFSSAENTNPVPQQHDQAQNQRTLFEDVVQSNLISQSTANQPEAYMTGQFSLNSNQTAFLPLNKQQQQLMHSSNGMLLQDQLNNFTQNTEGSSTIRKDTKVTQKATKSTTVTGSPLYTELFVWGNDNFGQLGLGHKYISQSSVRRDLRQELCDGDVQRKDKIPNSQSKRKILENPKSCSFSIEIRDVACGEDFAFLLTKRGLLYAMGSNQFGKLGILSQANLQAGQPGHLGVPGDQDQLASEVPFASTPKLVESLARHSIKKVSCGLNHAVAVTADQGLCYSWGCGSHGQLGRQSNKAFNLNPPQIVSYFTTRSIKVVDIAAGGKHTLFMTEDNQVMAAGMNDFGQLGQGDHRPRFQKNIEPSQVYNLVEQAKQIACGLVHSQILLQNGKVVSFGDNQFGQLGLGSEACITSTGTPKEVPTLQNIQSIACNHHSAAIGARGELYFWGTGVFGTFFEPKIIVEQDIVEVSVGGSFGIAKDQDGLLWTWGQNSNGELGLNDLKTRLYPHPILALKRKQIQKAVCGGSFAVAIGPDKKTNNSNKSPQRRKKSPFHNESALLKLLQEKHQKQQSANMTHSVDQIVNLQQDTSQNQTTQHHKLENVKIFSAREQSRMKDSRQSQSMLVVSGSHHNSKTQAMDPSFSQLQNSNLDIPGYNSSKIQTKNDTQQLPPSYQQFGNNLHNQSQLFVKEDSNTIGSKSNIHSDSLDLQQNTKNHQGASGAIAMKNNSFMNSGNQRLSTSQHRSRTRKKSSGNTTRTNNSGGSHNPLAAAAQCSKRSVSPILASNQSSTKNDASSTGPSFAKHSSTPKLEIKNQSGAFGGAVQAPRKRKSSQSRSKSKPRLAKSSSTINSRSNMQLNSNANNVSQLRMTNALTAKNGKENNNNRNTFQIASSSKADNTDRMMVTSMNSSFGGNCGTTGQNTNQQLLELSQRSSSRFPAPSNEIANTNIRERQQSAVVDLSVENQELQKQVELLQTQLSQINAQNVKLSAQAAKHHETLAEIRMQVHQGKPGQVIEQLTEEVQKAHDLEYLLRCKERQIEILRGEVDEARHLRVCAEAAFEKVQAQNTQVLEQNEILQTENHKLTEALEHAMNCCEQMKSQRNEYSERFGFLSNEMSSLRGLANDIQSQRQMKGQQGFNTQKHTANKPSLVDNPNVDNSQKTVKGCLLPPGGSNLHKRNPSQFAANQQAVISYDACDDFSSQRMTNNVAMGSTRIQTLGHASNDNGMQKLEPILEERYLQKRIPETTKHMAQNGQTLVQNNSVHEYADGDRENIQTNQSSMRSRSNNTEKKSSLDSSKNQVQAQQVNINDLPQHSYCAQGDQQQTFSINGTSSSNNIQQHQNQQHIQSTGSGSFAQTNFAANSTQIISIRKDAPDTNLSSQSQIQVISNQDNTSQQFDQQQQMKNYQQQLQQHSQLNEACHRNNSFSMQDLAIDPHVVKTLDLENKKRDQSADHSENEVTAVSAVDQMSHQDNKEQEKRRHRSRKRNKSTNSSKEATKVATTKSKIISQSKEKTSTNGNSSKTTFTGLSRKSVEQQRKRSISNDKSVKSNKVSKTAKQSANKSATPTALNMMMKQPEKSPQLVGNDAGFQSQSTVAVPEPIIILQQQQQNSQQPLSSNHEQSSQQVFVRQDSSLRQINLTVDSINKLAEIIHSTSAGAGATEQQQQQQLQQSLYMGSCSNTQDQSVLYTANHNQADHSVLLRSPPPMLNPDASMRLNNKAAENNNQMLRDAASPQPQQNAANLDSSSFIGNNPMLTLSGHDIQAVVSQTGIGLDQSNNNIIDTSALMHNLDSSNVQPSRKQNQVLHVQQIDSSADDYHNNITNSDPMSYNLLASSNPFNGQQQTTNQTNISKSVAKMQRDGLNLNRKPEIAAALRQSSQPNMQPRNTCLVNQSTNSSTMNPFFRHAGSVGMFDQQSSPHELDPAFRKSQLVIGAGVRSASLDGRKSHPAQARKKETIDNFKSKLGRLEKNKQDLENKMKLFDAKVKAHTLTQNIVEKQQFSD